MNIKKLDHHDIQKHRKQLLLFVKRHGDKRITGKAIRWLENLPIAPFPDGTFIAVVMLQGRLVGYTAIANYGKEEAFIVVHPAIRKKNIGEKLLRFTIQELGKIYTRVATDNIPSLKLCFHCGLKAFRLITGPTGKPTLLLGGGDWNEEEIPNEKNR